jgi:hypothetical protein
MLDTTQLDPATYGLAGWSMPYCAVNAGGTITGGVVYMMKIPLLRPGGTAQPVTLANVRVGLVTAGGTLTAGQNWLGICGHDYSLIGQTADMTTAFAGAPGPLKEALVGGPFTGYWPYVYGLILSNGTTKPAFYRGQGASIGASATLLDAPPPLPYDTHATTGLTTLPALLASSAGANAISHWMAVE